MSSLYRLPVFFNDTATTEIYTLSLHDALPISLVILVYYHAVDEALVHPGDAGGRDLVAQGGEHPVRGPLERPPRSEEHTSELQSRQYLVCRLLLEKKKNSQYNEVNWALLATLT